MLRDLTYKKLLERGVHKEDLELYFNEIDDEEIENDIFHLYFDGVSYSIEEKINPFDDSVVYEFKMEYDGGYQGYKREFTDIDVLTHHIERMCDIIPLLNKIFDIQSHLGDYKSVKREINLNKLI
jgi:hypothetical protein